MLISHFKPPVGSCFLCDLIIENDVKGRTCFDLSVIHCHIILGKRTTVHPGEAARIRGKAKIDKYGDLATKLGWRSARSFMSPSEERETRRGRS
jgi:hypothetical protein